MDTLPEFEEIPPMPPMATVRDSDVLYLAGVGGDSGMGGGGVHQSEYLILARFLSRDDRARS